MSFDNSKVIEVPEKSSFSSDALVIEIADLCFENNKTVEKIILPNTIEFIQPDAFKGCSKLKSVVFKNDIDSEEEFVIRSNNRLNVLFTSKTIYTVPSDISTIGKYAFGSCVKLRKIILHNNMKNLTVNSLAGCRSLKVVVLGSEMKKINFKALERANIREVVLPNGESVKTYDNYMFNSFITNTKGISFNYKEAARNFTKAKTERARYNIALDMLTNHSKEIGKEVSELAVYAIRYCIAKNNAKDLSKIMSLGLIYELDFDKLISYSKTFDNNEIFNILLENKKDCFSDKQTIKVEKPANETDEQKYIQVRFLNGKSYNYYCNYDVKMGDKVYVEGKLANEPGEVVALVLEKPKGVAAQYTLNVTSAFNVSIKELEESSEIEIEVPAKKAKKQLYIQVSFPKGRSYKYFCDYSVHVGIRFL